MENELIYRWGLPYFGKTVVERIERGIADGHKGHQALVSLLDLVDIIVGKFVPNIGHY
jgi:hypothetical protein